MSTPNLGSDGESAERVGLHPPESEALNECTRTTASFGLWPFVEVLRRNDLPLERVCERIELSAERLRDPGERFTQAAANRLATLAFERLGDSAAVAAALTVEAGHFHLLELITRTAPTVAEGIEACCQFFPLLHDCGKFSCARADDGARTVLWHPPDVCSVHHGYVELTFAVAVLGMCRETGCETLRPARVQFTHAAPAERMLHEQVLGPNLDFGAHQAAITFDAETTRVRFKRSNSAVHAAAVRSANDTLDE